jgi:hypothetical protein
MANPRNVGRMSIRLRPTDCVCLGLGSVKYVVCVVLDNKIVNSSSFRSALGAGFHVNNRHSLSFLQSFHHMERIPQSKTFRLHPSGRSLALLVCYPSLHASHSPWLVARVAQPAISAEPVHNVVMTEQTPFYFEVTTDREEPIPVRVVATDLNAARTEVQKTLNLKTAKQITEQQFQRMSWRGDLKAITK